MKTIVVLAFTVLNLAFSGFAMGQTSPPGEWTSLGEMSGEEYNEIFEGVMLNDGENGVLVVFYQGLNKAVGVAGGIGVPEEAMTFRGAGTVTLSLSGQDFEVPVQFSEPSGLGTEIIGLGFFPRNMSSPRPFPGQMSFLSRLPISRYIHVKEITHSDTGRTTEIGTPFRSNSCNDDGFNRIYRASGAKAAISQELCVKLFCSENSDFHQNFQELVSGAPEGTFLRPKSEILKNAEMSFVIAGFNGLVSFTEGICFGLNGLAAP